MVVAARVVLPQRPARPNRTRHAERAGNDVGSPHAGLPLSIGAPVIVEERRSLGSPLQRSGGPRVADVLDVLVDVVQEAWLEVQRPSVRAIKEACSTSLGEWFGLG